jgi:hypothetical protein
LCIPSLGASESDDFGGEIGEMGAANADVTGIFGWAANRPKALAKQRFESPPSVDSGQASALTTSQQGGRTSQGGSGSACGDGHDGGDSDDDGASDLDIDECSDEEIAQFEKKSARALRREKRPILNASPSSWALALELLQPEVSLAHTWGCIRIL